MRPPPFLLGAALLFWGWQTDFPAIAAVLAAILESSRFLKVRWEFSDEDFSRIWTFCTLLVLGATVYAFTENEGPSKFGGLLLEPNLSNQSSATTSGARTAVTVIRWLPLTCFLLIAAQMHSSREGVPLTAISLIARRRWKAAVKAGRTPPAGREIRLGYPYFALCLFAASAHGGQGSGYFWGLCVLLAWLLWSLRSPRFGLAVWAGALGTAIALAYFSQIGLAELQRLIESYNPQWFADAPNDGLDAKYGHTEIGHIGRLKLSGRIVIRLETQSGRPPPHYLREAAYRRYRSQVWDAARSKDDFNSVFPEKDLTTWLLQPRKVNTATVNLACYLDGGKGLLPLPEGSGRLENLPAFPLQTNSSGAALATGPGLVIFDAYYGPGPGIDSPPDTNDDLDVPPREVAALDQVIADQRLDRQSPEQAMQTINQFFQREFTYSLWQRPPKPLTTNETPLGRFLLTSRSGHCEYFATATVLLLRRLNIPARYAVGYFVHEPSGSRYVVRARDAHAWCLVWRDGAWQDFDTTPGSWIDAESKRASAFQFLSDFWSRIRFEISKLRWGQSALRPYLVWTLAPIMAFMLYQIIFRRGRRRQRRQQAHTETPAPWPGLDSEFYPLANALAQRGVARRPGEPLSVWLDRAAADPALDEVRATLHELLRLHYQYRFDPRGLESADRERLRSEARACLTRAQLGAKVT